MAAKHNEIVSNMIMMMNIKAANADSEENLHCKHPVFQYSTTICNVDTTIIDIININRIIKEQ